MQLKTKRLLLREPRLTEAAHVAKITSDLRIAQYLSAMPYPNKAAGIQKYLRGYFSKKKKKPRTEYLFAITLKGKSEVIGFIGIHDIEAEHSTGEFGYWLALEHWGKGIMSEAVAAIVRFSFTTLKLRRLQAEVFKANKASARVLKKNGFRLEGLRRQMYKAKSTSIVHDAYIYSILRDEWRQ
jgi:[ribosomal protein S5]-alanine N-acetyltransferase